MIRVVAFDLDDTLWHVEPVIRRAEYKLANWLADRVPGFSYNGDAIRQFRIDIIKESPELGYKLTEMRRRVIERALIAHMSDHAEASEIAAEAMTTFLAARNDVDFFEGALDTIKAISSRYHLGALTNGNADIRLLGLDDHFKFAFSAEEIGAPKPAPDLFHRAIEHTGCKPEEMVYVGDDPVKDVDAAKQVGLNTIWLRNDLRPGPAETDPDHTIDDIRELPDALTALNG